MSNKIFMSWQSWKVCFVAGVKNMFWGIMRIITAILWGFVSLLVYLWKQCCCFVRSFPDIALGMFIVISFLAWLITFVYMRSRTVTAENQRDSIAWQYHNFKEKHGYE